MRRLADSSATLLHPLLALAALAIAVQVEAQFRQRGFGGRDSVARRKATAADFDGRFQFCRVVFRRDFRGDGGDWSVD